MLIASEAIDSRLKSNIPGLLLKMDTERAYDHVNWDFLLLVMWWISWINWCISIASFSVLINGTPSGFFRSSKV